MYLSGPGGAYAPDAAFDGSDDTAYPRVDLGQPADPSFQAVEAVLPPLSADREHQVTLRVQELDQQLTDGADAKKGGISRRILDSLTRLERKGA